MFCIKIVKLFEHLFKFIAITLDGHEQPKAAMLVEKFQEYLNSWKWIIFEQ